MILVMPEKPADVEQPADLEQGKEEEGDGEGEAEEGGEVRGGEERETKRVELLEDEIDMRRYCPAGGPIVMEIFELPAPPKTVGQWTIRKGV